jgi:hypothetical protein
LIHSFELPQKVGFVGLIEADSASGGCRFAPQHESPAAIQRRADQRAGNIHNSRKQLWAEAVRKVGGRLAKKYRTEQAAGYIRAPGKMERVSRQKKNEPRHNEGERENERTINDLNVKQA